MNQKPAIPKDAAAVILIERDTNKVLWAQRNPALKFLGGYHAFAGGKVDAEDAEIKVKNCEDGEVSKFIVCAAREMFEEIGILLVRNGEKLTSGQRTSLHDDLISKRMSFGEILMHWKLWLDAEDFLYTGFWTTPPFSPMRFKTRFFLAICPPKQKPYQAITEMQNVEFIAPKEALKRWENSEVLISPPVLITLQTLSDNELPIANYENSTDTGNQKPKTENQKLSNITRQLLKKSKQCRGQIDYIELNSHLTLFPLKTKTLPPATHTNCFIVGKQQFIVIDAASKNKIEQQKLHRFINSYIEKGFVCRGIIVSHLHPDHFGGETVLQEHLQEKYGLQVPIFAHRLTAEGLRGKVEIEKYIEDDDIFSLRDEHGEMFELKALHTPGHARGHLCFYDESLGFLLSSDNVVGSGSVLIALPGGNMTEYLASLERMKNLPHLRFLCGSHGAAVIDAREKIEGYIDHRLKREKMVLEAVEEGAKTKSEIVEKVYSDVSSKLWKLAEKSVEAHLEKLFADGKLTPENFNFRYTSSDVINLSVR